MSTRANPAKKPFKILLEALTRICEDELRWALVEGWHTTSSLAWGNRFRLPTAQSGKAYAEHGVIELNVTVKNAFSTDSAGLSLSWLIIYVVYSRGCAQLNRRG